MSSLEYVFPQYPQAPVSISLFENVTNSSELREGLLAGNQCYNYAFIDAANVVSQEHLLAAIYRAVSAREEGEKMRTKNISSEIVFCMSPSNNIMDALKRFGISDTTTSVVVVKADPTHKANTDLVTNELHSLVRGDMLSVNGKNLQRFTDLNMVKKNYKVPGTFNFEDRDKLSSVVVGSVCLRGW
ncbi:hypothetical protein NADFUDRAFT_52922 [Nadsonia fulvescens var. elongata DSM 6958]|uniref:EKC/KEOPS complex subunit CGI121 n=1 Tax=Nadsonia fulvescens var. elongata DSM 6958 TaxID=857566 RepID=A0A1E3PEU5_9ASCO|nr:hypothetical protein NADFUDRAFT_52922 [Nadsonia fulvescens var. elongata DSM 6958]